MTNSNKTDLENSKGLKDSHLQLTNLPNSSGANCDSFLVDMQRGSHKSLTGPSYNDKLVAKDKVNESLRLDKAVDSPL